MIDNRKNNHPNEGRTFTVREDTIFDYLMHAATREDIAKLDAKIDRVASYLDSKIDGLRHELKDDIAKLDAKIDRVAGHLDSKIDRVEERLTKKVDAHFKWLTGFLIIAVMAPFVANLIT